MDVGRSEVIQQPHGVGRLVRESVGGSFLQDRRTPTVSVVVPDHPEPLGGQALAETLLPEQHLASQTMHQ